MAFIARVVGSVISIHIIITILFFLVGNIVFFMGEMGVGATIRGFLKEDGVKFLGGRMPRVFSVGFAGIFGGKIGSLGFFGLPFIEVWGFSWTAFCGSLGFFRLPFVEI